MKTKEAIDYVESKRYVMGHCGNNKLADEVIELLQRGEENRKYKKMWEELKFDYICHAGWCEAEAIEELEQKYFPKPKPDKNLGELGGREYIKSIRNEIEQWREIARGDRAPALQGEGFEKGWRLAINRVCNSIENILKGR